MNKVEFEGAQGHKLAARLDMPGSGAPKAFALFAHCFTCSKDIFAATRISKTLTENGIATLRFDFTGLGASEGDFANTNFTSNVNDLIKAADYLRENHAAPAIMIGHSLGGAATLVAAGQVEGCKAVVTLGAPADAAHVAHHFESKHEEIKAKGEAEVCLVGRPFRIQKQFIDDIETQNMDKAIQNLKKPLLIMHAPLDATVGIENAEHIFVQAKHPKSFVSLDDSDHLISKKKHAEYAGQVIASWAGLYIGISAEPQSSIKTNSRVAVKETGPAYQQIVQMGKHVIVSDEPTDIGGKDTGADPYELLLAALGTCTGVTLRMYANHKDLPLENIEVHLDHSRVHAEDCKEGESEKEMLDHIERKLIIHGENLTDEHHAKLLEIADKCPVHKTLEKKAVVVTSAERGQTAKAA